MSATGEGWDSCWGCALGCFVALLLIIVVLLGVFSVVVILKLMWQVVP